MTRPDWDETWFAVAAAIAKRSLCVRDQVGAVIVDPRNRIVATGYNGPPHGFTILGGRGDDDLFTGRSCSEWCSRAKQQSQVGWKVPIPSQVEILSENDVTYAKWGSHIRPLTDELARNMGLVPIFPELASDYSDCPSLHAEANALSVCDRSVREGGTIYVTSHVCFGCAKLIANSGLVNLYVLERNTDAEKMSQRQADKSYNFLEQCGVTVYLQ